MIIVPASKEAEEQSRTIVIPAGTSVADIQAEIDKIKKWIKAGVTITIQFEDGTYDATGQHLILESFWGMGSLIVQGNINDTAGPVLARSVSITKDYSVSDPSGNYGFQVQRCRCQVTVRFIHFSGTNADNQEWNPLLFFSDCLTGLTVDNCSFEFPSASYGSGAFFYYAAGVSVLRSYFKGGYYGLEMRGGKYGGWLTSGGYNSPNVADGTLKPTYGHYANEGGRVYVYGTAFQDYLQGSSGDKSSTGGAIIT